MRIAHATDVHWYVPAGFSDLARSPKRSIGTLNLVLRGRRHHFDPAVQAGLIEHLCSLDVDGVVITGDLTSTASEAEFALARKALEPVFRRHPTFVIPGNHDRYTHGSVNPDRMIAHFADQMGDGDAIRVRTIGDVDVVGVDVCHPTWLDAHGTFAVAEGLSERLGSCTKPVVLAVHYPPVTRRGVVNDGRSRGLFGAQRLLDVIQRHPPVVVLCGHEHHGYRRDLPGSGVPMLNCGSSGYAYMPEKRRAAATSVLTIESGRLALVERFLWDGARFSPEPGGAYATGR